MQEGCRQASRWAGGRQRAQGGGEVGGMARHACQQTPAEGSGWGRQACRCGWAGGCAGPAKQSDPATMTLRHWCVQCTVPSANSRRPASDPAASSQYSHPDIAQRAAANQCQSDVTQQGRAGTWKYLALSFSPASDLRSHCSASWLCTTHTDRHVRGQGWMADRQAGRQAVALRHEQLGMQSVQR